MGSANKTKEPLKNPLMAFREALQEMRDKGIEQREKLKQEQEQEKSQEDKNA